MKGRLVCTIQGKGIAREIGSDVDVVVFRRYPDGEIIALFPNLGYPIYTSRPGHVMSYLHVGQHGDANYHLVIRDTKPARPSEYGALKRELESIGYKLKVMQKLGGRRK